MIANLRISILFYSYELAIHYQGRGIVYNRDNRNDYNKLINQWTKP